MLGERIARSSGLSISVVAAPADPGGSPIADGFVPRSSRCDRPLLPCLTAHAPHRFVASAACEACFGSYTARQAASHTWPCRNRGVDPRGAMPPSCALAILLAHVVRRSLLSAARLRHGRAAGDASHSHVSCSLGWRGGDHNRAEGACLLESYGHRVCWCALLRSSGRPLCSRRKDGIDLYRLWEAGLMTPHVMPCCRKQGSWPPVRPSASRNAPLSSPF